MECSLAESMRSMPQWRRLNADRLLYIKSLEVIDEYIGSDNRLSQGVLLRRLKVDYLTLIRVYDQYPVLPRLVSQSERNRRIKAPPPKGRYLRHSTAKALVSYRRAYASLLRTAEKGKKPTGRQVAELVGVTAKSALEFMRRHPEVKQVN